MDFPFLKEAVSNLFSKSSCDMYPFVPAEAAPNYRGRIAFHADKCIGCGMCARNCPANAIAPTDYTAPGKKKPAMAIDSTKCVKCGACISTCKFGAIYKD